MSSNSDYLLQSLAMLEKRAGVLQDEPASSSVIYVDFRQAARPASRLSWSDCKPTSDAMTSSTSDLLF